MGGPTGDSDVPDVAATDADGSLFAGIAERPEAPSQRRETFAVPQLALWVDGELEAVEPDYFLDSGWTVRGCDATLSEVEFPTQAHHIAPLNWMSMRRASSPHIGSPICSISLAS